MLVLTRRANQRIMIGRDVVITVLESGVTRCGWASGHRARSRCTGGEVFLERERSGPALQPAGDATEAVSSPGER